MNQAKKTTALLEANVFTAGRSYLQTGGFTELFPPRVVRASGACENIDTLFTASAEGQTNWWTGKENKKLPAYLAQTAQLYLEAFVPQLDKVFCIGPSFRAEPKIDDRHLTEFTMAEIEFAGNFQDLLKHIEGFIKTIAGWMVEHQDEAIKDWGLTADDISRLNLLPDSFPKITYDEAIEILAKHDASINWGDDISTKHEKLLIKLFNNHPLFITHYPDPMWDHGKETEVEKFFNMIPDPEKTGRVQSTDLILPFAGESVGAAARIYDVETLKKRLVNSRMYKRLLKKGGSLDDFHWYINNLENQGSVPHAGCGFGMARIIQWVKGADTITHGVAFPSNKANLI